MSPLRKRSRRRARGSSALLLALGALTGLALGAVLADRVGGFDKLLGGTSKRPRNVRRDGAILADDDIDDPHDDAHHEDDDEALFVARADEDATGITDDEADDEDNEPLPASMERHNGVHEVPDDNTLEERVLEAFHNDPVLAERAIDIGAIGTGVIELTGWVQSSWEIGHAVTLARGVPDVTTVVDRLAVRDGERRRDHSGRHYSGPVPTETSGEAGTPRAD